VTVNGYLDIGILDTMKDLFVNFIGAFVFSVIGFFYIKYRGEGPRGRFTRRFILTKMEESVYTDGGRISSHAAKNEKQSGRETADR
jgi:hypothetical protein